MPVGKIKVNGQWYTLGLSSNERDYILSSITQNNESISLRVTKEDIDKAFGTPLSTDISKLYAEDLKTDTSKYSSDLHNQVSSTLSYIDEATGSDGIIYNIELDNINSHMNVLGEVKIAMDGRYKFIHDSDHISTEVVSTLELSKSHFDNKYTSVVDTVGSSLSDQMIDSVEHSSIHSVFNDFTSSINALLIDLDKAVDNIAETKRIISDEEATTHSDDLKSIFNPILEDMQASVQSMESDIEKAFLDSRILELEKQSIQSHIDYIKGSKQKLDAEYDKLFNDMFLNGSTKIDLFHRNTEYTSKYNNLIQSIQSYISDGTITSAEKSDINMKFYDHDNAYNSLYSAFNNAAVHIGKSKSSKIFDHYKSYTDGTLAPVEMRVSKAESSIVQNSDQIALRVTKEEYDTGISGLDTRLTSAESSIVQNADSINLRVTKETYNTEMSEIKNNIVYKVEIESSNGNVFKNGQISTVLYAKVYHGADDVTDTIDASRFRWTRTSDDPTGDEAWNTSNFGGTKQVTVTKDDVNVRATFSVKISQT